MYQEYIDEYKRTKNVKGFKNFLHYLWARFVFFIFGLFENEIDWYELKRIIFAPIIEEFMFRGIIFGLYRDSGIFVGCPRTCVVFLPLYFSVAHINALWLIRDQPWS